MTARLETVRIFVVVLSVLYALAFGVPTVLALNGYYGTVGLVRAGTIATLAPNVDVNTISSVAPGSPAARSGIVPGDVAVPLAAEHAFVVQQLFSRVAAGRPIPYVVLHNEQRRIVMLTPTPVVGSAHDDVLVVAQLVRGFLIVLMGAALVLLRPSLMTAAFFVLCLQFGELAHPYSNTELLIGVPYFWKPLFLVLTCLVTGAGAAVATIFCTRFPSGEPLPRWRPVERAMIALGIFMILDYFFALVAGATYTPLGTAFYRVFTVASWLGYAIATISFLARYRASSGEDRERLRWVAIGLGAFLASYALYWISQNVPSAPRELNTWAQFVNVLPLTVLYAIIRHHVVDVRLAGGRALAFAVLSAIPVTAFGIIDWVLSNKVQQTRFGVLAEVAVAIAFGFWVNSLQHRIDIVIERLFFRRSRVAEERLRVVARQTAYVSDRTTLDEMLVREPFEALELASCALFLRNDETYVRVSQRNFPDDAPTQIDAKDDLVTTALETRTWGDTNVYPIVVRQQPFGLLLLGAKRDGERLDALERVALQNLVDSAAMTYDHLEAVEQRSVADDLRRALAVLQRENEMLRASRVP